MPTPASALVRDWICAYDEERDDDWRSVTMYISDREILERLGKISAPASPAAEHRVEHA